MAQLGLQGVALALAAELLPLVALDQVVLPGLLRRAAEEPREDNLVQGDEREKLSRQRQRNALETQLRHAVETENFEEAAKLRDQLRSLPQA